MILRFQFDPEKAIQAMGYLLRSLGRSIDKAKLMKLLYIADRAHFLTWDHPITGDKLVAMPKGPVPSNSLNLLNRDFARQWDAAIDAHLGLENHEVLLKSDPGISRLDRDEKATLDAVLKEHGHKRTWSLVEETHKYPEYCEAYVEGTSRPIPYELLLRHYKPDSLHRGRVVITERMLSHATCPFPNDDSDL